MTATHSRIMLSEVAAAMQGILQGDDVVYAGASTDTRKVQQGQLYVALRGPNFDGHNFVLDAVQNGAAAVVVEQTVDVDVPQVIVDDTRVALGQLAAAWRARFDIPVIAITGSNGKTTVKEMLAAIFAQRGSVHATQANLNNEIGVPLTLLAMRDHHQAAIIEEGASHAGDIAYLTQFVRPTVALVNNVSGAHLEGFGSLDMVAKTKAEIYRFLRKDGTAIINADDHYASVMREAVAGREMLSFGMDNPADVQGQWHSGNRLVISVTGMGSSSISVDIELPLEGRHNAMNALAATAAALAAGADLDQIRAGLESMAPVAGRLQWKAGIQASRILDDTYNANPVSLKAALDVLAHYQGGRYLALGDMAELGEQAEILHEQAGLQARDAGVDQLYAVGEFTRHTVAAFGDQAFHFPAQEQMISQLKKDLHDNVAILVKGSRSAHMEKVVAALVAEENQGSVA